MFLFVGSTARSAMRPEIIAGPMLRRLRPENVSDFIGPVSVFFASASDFFESDLSAALASGVVSCARSVVPIVSAADNAARSSDATRDLLDTMTSPDGWVARGYGRRAHFAHAGRHAWDGVSVTYVFGKSSG